MAIEDYRVSGAKEARIINIVEPIMAQHRLVLDTSVAKDKENQYQITRIHGGRGALRHDDRIDVLSAAVKYWEDALGLDVDQTIQKNQRQEKQEVIKNWLSDNRFYGLLGDKASGALRLQKQPPRKNNKWSIKRRK